MEDQRRDPERHRVTTHVDDDTSDVNFEEIRTLGQTFYDRNTGVELDPKGVQAARQEAHCFWRWYGCSP